jgi:hypothetical protein
MRAPRIDAITEAVKIQHKKSQKIMKRYAAVTVQGVSKNTGWLQPMREYLAEKLLD